MSRLSRFKKAPEVKLPSKIRGRFEDDDDDSDEDDFKKPIKRMEIVSASEPTKKEKNKGVSLKDSRKTKVQPATKYGSPGSSFSEYFPLPSQEVKKRTEKETKLEKGSNNDINIPAIRKPTSKAQKSESKREGTSTHSSFKREPDAKESRVSSLHVESQIKDNEKETMQNSVFCPFCWKKLGDKLTGTTHIKSCAKDLPIEQIQEAILLQEKQIQEWQHLGLSFPAFTADAKKGSKSGQPSKARGGGGRGRKKKQEDNGGVDPQLELAMALSVSLHEEVETRKEAENQFLIEHGLDKELGLQKLDVPSSSTATSRTSTVLTSEKNIKKAIKIPSPAASTSSSSTVRRRGKKIQLESLPLYTVDDDQKKLIVAERVAQIMDESMSEEREDYFIREKLSEGSMGGVPKRLQEFHDKEATLWNGAKDLEDAPAESFSVVDLNLSRPVVMLEMSHMNSAGYVDENEYTAEKDRSHNLNPSALIDKEGAPSALMKSPIKLKSSTTLKPSSDHYTRISKGSKRQSKTTSHFSNKSTKHLPPVVRDLAAMLCEGIDCDITLFGKEEKPIKCHRFMLSARCPKILEEVIVEERGDLPTRQIVALVSYHHETVKAFIWYIYTGTVDSTDESILEDIRELGRTYNIPITCKDEVEKTIVTNTAIQGSTKVVDANIQTDALYTTDSADTENDNAETSEERCDNDNDDIGAAAGDFQQEPSYVSQELFTTFDDGNEEIDHENEHKGHSSNQEQNDVNFKPHHSLDASVDKEIEIDNTDEVLNTSVELFGDVEDDNCATVLQLQEEPQAASNKSIPRVTLDTSNPDVESHNKASDSDSLVTTGDSNFDDYLNDLLSPTCSQRTQTSSEKKRARCISPLVGDESVYSATQIADMLQCHADGYKNVNVSPSRYFQAPKKQKLDNDIIGESFRCFDESESERTITKAVVESDNMNDCDNMDIVWNESHNDFQSESMHFGIDNAPIVTDTPKNSRSRMLRRSISTPDLMSVSNSRNNQQGSSHKNTFHDPFDTFDDSVFAKIPDDVFNNYDVMPTSSCNGRATPPSRSQKRLSPRILSSDSSSTELTVSKSRGKAKNKTAAASKPKPAKIKLPKNIVPRDSSNLSSQRFQAPNAKAKSQKKLEPVVDNEDHRSDSRLHSQPNPSNSKAKGGSKKSNDASPMLNYSLIDTPVLKQELKRYGLKPLPRSKAKVLLRHIYKETHKP